MRFPLEKYSYYVEPAKNGKGTKIIAKSTFAGKTVKGTAQCNPEDTYDFEKGKAIAAARCAVKIAGKRIRRAEECLNEAYAAIAAAEAHANAMEEYVDDAYAELEESMAFLEQQLHGEN